jgi:hypothetical protein
MGLPCCPLRDEPPEPQAESKDKRPMIIPNKDIFLVIWHLERKRGAIEKPPLKIKEVS